MRFRSFPFWKDFIEDKSAVATAFHAEFDRLASSFGVPFWVTQEHAPAGGEREWSREEIAAGLDRLYRIILRVERGIPAGLAERARLITDFEYVRAIDVGESALPTPSRATEASVLTDNSRDLIHTRQAHLFGRGNPDVRVAVLDTGVSLAHPELRERIVAGADFVDLRGLDTRAFIGDFVDADPAPEDEVGHGSHVAGIAVGAGRQMPIGVAPNCSLLAVRVLAALKDGDRVVGAGIPDNINAGIKWAVDHGADVINVSAGIKRSGGGLPHEEVIRYAIAKGVTVVAASGNDGTDEKYYPGSLPGVIAVGATDRSGKVASFTSFGAPVWMLAPGTDVLSAYAQGRYAHATGTSQASPFVAGAVALLKSIARDRGARLSDRDVKEILAETCDRPDTRLRTERTGYGCLNLVDACRLLVHRLRGGRSARAARTPSTFSLP
ncbi:S8 family peptidase [Sandaracinus amylolyticus]|uniref:S8 family peptidase n=1 Tax=Sandaracinus amylolyticus TaxID=927083 RepID=UPI001F4089E6|nr:S8 family serine peptidase [Sandaracinus amylolyticus]